jgi:hypothetical protein
VHALLGGVSDRKTLSLKKDSTARMTTLWHVRLIISTDKNPDLLEHWLFKDHLQREN